MNKLQFQITERLAVLEMGKFMKRNTSQNIGAFRGRYQR